MADVFVSYSRSDRTFVTRLAQALEEREREVWVDTDDIPPTAEWLAEIESAIAASDAVLVVLSPKSLASPVCRQETDHAHELNKRIVPVLRAAVDPTQVPSYIAKHNWIDATDDALFSAAVDDITIALDTDLDWARMHTRVLVRAQEWEAAKRDRSYLLRGSELSDAEAWLATQPAGGLQQPTALQAEYVRASREAQRRRQRRLSTLLGAGLLLTSALAVFAWTQRNTAIEQEQVARSRALSASAVAQLPVDPELGILLAGEALRLAPGDAAAAQAMREALRDSYVRQEGQHEAGVTAMDVSADGRWVVSGSSDDSAALWDARDGRRVAVVPHEGDVVSVSFASDAPVFVTASRTGDAHVWDAASATEVAVLEHGSPQLLDVALSPDGAMAATAGSDGEVVLWEVGDRRPQRLSEGAATVQDVAFNGDGTRLAVAGGSRDGRRGILSVYDRRGRSVGEPFAHQGARGRGRGGDALLTAVDFSKRNTVAAASRDGTVAVWDLSSGRRISLLRGHREAAVGVRFDDTGQRLLTASFDGTARLWNAASGDEIRDYQGHSSFVVSATFSEDGRFVVTGSDDGTARIFNTRTEETVAVLRGHRDLVTAAFVPEHLPSGGRVATASLDGRVRFWEGWAGDLVAQYEGHHEREPLAAVITANFAAQSARVVTAGEDGTAAVWDATTGEELSVFEHNGPVEDASFTATGDRVVTASWDGTARTWTANAQPVAVFDDHEDFVETAVFSPDGALALSAGDDGYARIWDPRTGKEIHALGPHGDIVWNAIFSPDGKTVATASAAGIVALWDVETGEQLHLLGEDLGDAFGLAFAPDSQVVAAWGYAASADNVLGSVHLWNVVDGDPLPPLVHPLAVEDATFSDDGQTLMTGAHTNHATLWNWRRAEQTLVLQGHTAQITAVAMAPNPRWVATASLDGTARLWDTTTGMRVATLRGHTGDVFDITFSADGQHVATAGSDGLAQVYACELCADVAALLELAPQRVFRTFDAAERERYLLPAAADSGQN